MDCHEVLGTGLTSESTAPFLFYFQYSYSSFRCVVVRWNHWVFQEVEHMVFEFSQTVADLPERLPELIEIFVEKVVEAFHPRCRIGHGLGILVSPMHGFSQ